MLVAYDGSVAARRALVHAARFALSGDPVTVVNVMPEPGVGAQIGPPPEARNHQWQLLDDAQQFLAARGIAADTADPVGDAATEILATAKHVGADVIVLAHSRRKVPHVHASTTARVIRGADCDVLVVHASDAEA